MLYTAPHQGDRTAAFGRKSKLLAAIGALSLVIMLGMAIVAVPVCLSTSACLDLSSMWGQVPGWQFAGLLFLGGALITLAGGTVGVLSLFLVALTRLWRLGERRAAVLSVGRLALAAAMILALWIFGSTTWSVLRAGGASDSVAGFLRMVAGHSVPQLACVSLAALLTIGAAIELIAGRRERLGRIYGQKPERFTDSPLFVFFALFAPMVALLVAALMGHRLVDALPLVVMLQALFAAARARSQVPLAVVALVLLLPLGQSIVGQLQNSDAMKLGHALFTLASAIGLMSAFWICLVVTFIGFIPTRLLMQGVR